MPSHPPPGPVIPPATAGRRPPAPGFRPRARGLWAHQRRAWPGLPGLGLVAWGLAELAAGTARAGAFFGLLAFLGLCAASGRVLVSLAGVGGLFASVVLAAHAKIYYLGSPLSLADVEFFVRDLWANAELFRSYWKPALWGTLWLALFGLLAGWLVRVEARQGRAFRLGALGSALALAGYGAWHGLVFPPAAATGADFGHIDRLDHRVVLLAEKEAGMDALDHETFDALTPAELIEFFFAHHDLSFDLPRRVGAWWGRGQGQGPFRPTPAPGADAGPRPDIMVVLNESMFDPELLAPCAIRESFCHPAIFGPPAGHPGRYGPLFVAVHGGGTWLSEFALLTGYDWRTFGPGGVYAPFTVTRFLRTSLVMHLKRLGYRTVMVHPANGEFMEARETAHRYGFDEFYDANDLGITTAWRDTPDALVFQKTLALLAAPHAGAQKPVFAFVLTTNNHGPHASHYGAIRPVGLIPKLAAADWPPRLADYLERLRQTDLALRGLEDTWLAAPRPRVLAWFGDHQARLTEDLPLNQTFLAPILGTGADGRREGAYFVTWYRILSNLPATPPASVPATTALPYLGAETLALAELPLPPDGAATLEMAQRCPRGPMLCADTGLVDAYLSFRVWRLGEIRPRR